MRPESLYEAISWKGRIPVVRDLGFDCENRLPTADLLLICHEFRCRRNFGELSRAFEKPLLIVLGEAVHTAFPAIFLSSSRRYFRSDVAMVMLGARSIRARGWVDTFVVHLDGFPGAKDISGPSKM